MSQALSVFFLADLVQHDPEGATHWRAVFAACNEVLAEGKLASFVEPERKGAFSYRGALASFSSAWPWRLRRAMAYLTSGQGKVPPVKPGQDAGRDPVLEEELYMFRSHLLSLTASQGVFVPVDFNSPAYAPEDSKVPGGFVGSSHALRRELVRLAPALGIALENGTLSDATAAELAAEPDAKHPLSIERKTWLSFFVTADASVRLGTALVMH